MPPSRDNNHCRSFLHPNLTMPNPALALRALRRSPTFTTVAIGSLALALGLVSAVFGFIEAFRNPRSASHRPEQLYRLAFSGDGAAGQVTTPDHFAALQQLRTVTGIAYHRSFDGMAVAGTRIEHVVGGRVSADFFALLGVRPRVGRLFSQADDRSGGATGVVIDERLWARLFDGRGPLDELALTIDGARYDVIGVVPQALSGEIHESVWLLDPAPATRDLSRAGGWSRPLVRLRDGETRESLTGDLQRVAEWMTAAHGEGRRPFQYRAYAVKREPLELSQLHWLLLVAALSVLLMACANLANLVLARGLSRQRDLAVRLSLGARRRDIVAEVLAECVLVALAGAALGVMAAAWAVDLAKSQLPETIPFVGRIVVEMNWRVVGMSTLAASVAAALFGVLPALRLSDIDLADRMKSSSGSSTPRSRGRYSALVIGQVALALTLLTGAGLLGRASHRLAAFDFGFDAERLLRVSASPGRRGVDTARVAAVLSAIESRLAAMPRVQSVAWHHPRSSMGSAIGERPDGSLHSAVLRGYEVVSPNYLRTLGLSVVRGRDFEPRDALGNGAAIIDEEAARLVWGPDDPLGRLIKLDPASDTGPWLRVVGVAKRLPADPRTQEAPPPLIWSTGPLLDPRAPAPNATLSRWFVVRVNPADQVPLMVEIQRMLRDVVPAEWPRGVAPWNENFRELQRTQSFLTGLFAGFGVVALLLCAIGLYSVLSFAVSQRLREYGIRIAIGATRRDIFRTVLRDGAVLVLAGTALGGFASIWSNKLVDRYILMFYHIDAVALVLAETILVLVALAAVSAPARRATRSDPVAILRAS